MTIEITAVTKMVFNPFNHTSTLIYELEVQIQGLADPSALFFNNLGSCGYSDGARPELFGLPGLQPWNSFLLVLHSGVTGHSLPTWCSTVSDIRVRAPSGDS